MRLVERRTGKFLLTKMVLLVWCVPALAQLSPQPLQTADKGVAAPRVAPQVPSDVLPKVPVSNQERSSLQITASDLDVHIVPAAFREEVHASLTLVNVSAAALSRIPLQISGSLRWESVTTATPAGLKLLAFTQSPIATDADHTGYAQEMIVTPPQPLAPGGSLVVSVFYAGEIRQSGDRFELLGERHDIAAQADWDAIAPTSNTSATALRGLGNVLWYPVAAPTVALGDGNKLSELIARQKMLGVTASIRLRLTVEYIGDPPDSVIFNGRPQPLLRTPDLDDQLVEETHGLAVAAYAAAPIGFRVPSLFLTAQHAVATEGQLLSIISPDPSKISAYADAAVNVRTMLAPWLGPTPLLPLTLLDHTGQRFEDGSFIAGELKPSVKSDSTASELVRGLTHAWFRTSGANSLWLDEGVPELMGLLWIERTVGREAAIAEMYQASVSIALVEPDFTATPLAVGQPLTAASTELFLRKKSANVLWQLRELVGEAALREALAAFRHSLSLNAAISRDPSAFQKTLEHVAGKDLSWFFNDWVYRDRGLPDLTVVQVNPRPLPARPGKNAGYLVAVEVKNEGDAVADVPVIVRSGSLSSTERLRIPGHASVSIRVLFEGSPETVQVNDGSTPELRTSIHLIQVPQS